MSGSTSKRIRRLAKEHGWTRFQYQHAKRAYKRDEVLTASNGAPIPVRQIVQAQR